jgi:carboxymethylenebutenolidase
MPDLTDPIRSTNPAFKRSVFVGISASAAALIGPAAALAADEGLGKPHPPLVAEDDPDIVVSTPQIGRYTGPTTKRAIDAYYAAPRAATATTPGIVVVMQIWGVDAQTRDTVRRFAKAGYRTIAPNLYAGLGAPNGDGSTTFSDFQPMAAKLADEVVDEDLIDSAGYLTLAYDIEQTGGAGGLYRASHIKIGVTGFCMGGSITLRQAVEYPQLYSAAAIWYGKVRYGTTGNNGAITPIALAYADELRTPLLGSWGERDTSILGDDVRALDHRLSELHKPHDLKVYPTAGHGFFDDTRSSYDAFAADDAWTRTLAWFARYLH